MLTEPPATLKLTFNEPVSPLVFRLIGPGGEVINPGVAAENATVTLTPPRLRQGTHVLSWRVISADGHPVGGSLLFSVGAPSAPPTAAALNASDMAVRVALWAAKVVIYIGLFVGIGGAFFRAWIADPTSPTPRGWLIAALALGLLAVVYSVSFQGLDALDLPFMDALDPLTWTAGIATSYGLTAIAAAIALLAGLVSLAARWRGVARALSLLGICGAALALALSGHATTAPPRLLTTPSVFLHVLCVTFWVGALVPLIAAARAADVGAFARFSRAIPYPLAVIVVTGVALAFVQLDRVDALWTTNYGLVLSGKLAAVAALLALAAANRYWLTPRFRVQDATAARRAHDVDRRRARHRVFDHRAGRALALHAAAASAGRGRAGFDPLPWRARDGADRGRAGARARRAGERPGARRRVSAADGEGGDARLFKSRSRHRAGAPHRARARAICCGGSTICAFRSPAAGGCGSKS